MRRVTGQIGIGLALAALAGMAPTAAGQAAATDPLSDAVASVHPHVVALEHGSNFRDLGGYQSGDGRHVRYGMIYRSGATPLLTDADIARIKGLNINSLVDLRSSEERVLAPTRLDGIRYAAVGYSTATMMAPASSAGGLNLALIYRGFPTMLAPQLKIIFHEMAQPGVIVAYNCSAGQDRTGFATAMVLSALGVPRPTIIKDYLLSTVYRHPEYEMPEIDAATAATNAAAGMFARFQQDPRYRTPRPLYGPDNRPYLAFAFDEIDQRWGSTDAYLHQAIGLSRADLLVLRRKYLH